MCMKKIWNGLNDLKKSLILSSLVTVILIAISVVGIIFGQPGWMIGVAIGGVIQLVNVVLHFKGAEFVLQQEKMGLFLVAFFARMFLIICALVLCIVLDRVAGIGAFKNAIFGVIIGLAPMEIILIFTLKPKKEVETK